MRRREFITILGSTAIWPLAASAQQRLLRIGYMGLTTAADARYLPNLLAGLSELGYVEGKNLQVELRFANGDDGRLPGLAAELVGLNVDVIVAAATGVPAARGAIRGSLPRSGLVVCWACSVAWR